MLSTIELPDGRTLAYECWGDPDGAPVFLFHGTPGSRLDFAPSPVMPTGDGRGGRFIAVDRPGVGQSEPQPGRRLDHWSWDMVRLADHLGLERFRVLGYSGGGAYALRCALDLPDRVERVIGVGSVVPPLLRSLTDGTGVAPRAALGVGSRLPLIGEPLLAVAFRAIDVASSLAFTVGTLEMCDADRQILGTHHLRENRRIAYLEGAAHGTRGPMHDVALVGRSWEFDIERIGVPVTLWAGADDNFVPLVQQEALARVLPDAELHVVPHAGHCVLFQCSETILADAVG